MTRVEWNKGIRSLANRVKKLAAQSLKHDDGHRVFVKISDAGNRLYNKARGYFPSSDLDGLHDEWSRVRESGLAAVEAASKNWQAANDQKIRELNQEHRKFARSYEGQLFYGRHVKT